MGHKVRVYYLPNLCPGLDTRKLRTKEQTKLDKQLNVPSDAQKHSIRDKDDHETNKFQNVIWETDSEDTDNKVNVTKTTDWSKCIICNKIF